MVQLNENQRRTIAASLEIDGRVDIAAQAVVPGHISEFTYRGTNYEPLSVKAKQLAEVTSFIQEAIATLGLAGSITHFRSAEVPLEDGYSWLEWEQDEATGIYALTIIDGKGDEVAVVIHRTYDDQPPHGEVAEAKKAHAQLIVDALNAYTN